MSTEQLTQESTFNDDDYVVIKASTLLAAGVGIVAMVAGLFTGYFLATNIYLSGIRAVGGDPTGGTVAQAQEPSAPTRLSDVSVDDDAIIGPADAPITIVEFSDYQCPYCKRFRDQTMDSLFDEYGDQIRFVFRDYPLAIHADAQKASEAAECAREIAGDTAYWEMHDTLFANQVVSLRVDALKEYANALGVDSDEFNTCLDDGLMRDEVLADLREGQSYGVNGTPTFFINGIRLVGAQPLAAFQNIIDQELAELN